MMGINSPMIILSIPIGLESIPTITEIFKMEIYLDFFSLAPVFGSLKSKMKRKAAAIEEEKPDEKVAIPKMYPWFQSKVIGYLRGSLVCSKCECQKFFRKMDVVEGKIVCNECYESLQQNRIPKLSSSM